MAHWVLDNVFDYRARRRLSGKVTVGNGSSVVWRKINLKRYSRVRIGDSSMVSAALSFDKEGAVIEIGTRTFIGASRLVCADRISIGDDVMIAWGATLVDHDSHSIRWSERRDDVVKWIRGEKDWTHVATAPIKIDDKAWIGFNAIILKGVSVGAGAIVAAGSVVTKSVPPFSIVAGNPAKVVRELQEDER